LDWGVRFEQWQLLLTGQLFKQRNIILERFSPFIPVSYQVDTDSYRLHQMGRRCGCVEQTSGAAAEQGTGDMTAGHASAAHAKRLAERTDANGNVIRKAKLGCETPTLWPHHPERVGLININQRTVAVGYLGNLVKWRQVSVHTEYRIGYD
jgi:hypothetical protein